MTAPRRTYLYRISWTKIRTDGATETQHDLRRGIAAAMRQAGYRANLTGRTVTVELVKIDPAAWAPVATVEREPWAEW